MADPLRPGVTGPQQYSGSPGNQNTPPQGARIDRRQCCRIARAKPATQLECHEKSAGILRSHLLSTGLHARCWAATRQAIS
jgi:hypothetical protein